MPTRRSLFRAFAALSLASLTPFTGCGGGSGGSSGPLAVGIVHAVGTPKAEDVRSKLDATGFFASVTSFDAQLATPTASQLAAFDVVLVMSDEDFDDPALLGDRLADAVDAGIGVVLSMFTHRVTAPTGRFATDDYFTMVLNDPIEIAGDGPFGWDTTDITPPLLTGVSVFGGGIDSFRADVSPKAGATLVASWFGGGNQPLIVERDLPNGRRRVDLNFFPVTSDQDSDFVDPSDSIRMVANALLRVGGRL